MENLKSLGIPMISTCSLEKDVEGKTFDDTKYRGMIGSLIYLTAFRSDIIFSGCKCTRFQSSPNEYHLTSVKNITYYLVGTFSSVYGIQKRKIALLKDFFTLTMQVVKTARKVIVLHVIF